jgi:hypothetical protein
MHVSFWLPNKDYLEIEYQIPWYPGIYALGSNDASAGYYNHDLVTWLMNIQ